MAVLGFTASDRDILGEDRIELTSVGVDIGSSTSHLVFSRLVLERETQRYRIVERSIIHESPILLTPYADATTIDGPVLERFILDQYETAGYLREEIDSGAVILTGTALHKDNSRMIADLFAAEAGKFVAVSAGDRLEASLAAHGSGAVAASRERPDAVLNVDIGGGTTKLAICLAGEIQQVMAVDIGARLVAFTPDGVVSRVEDAGAALARRLGIRVEVGSRITEAGLRRMAADMAERLIELIRGEDREPETNALLRTPPFTYRGPIGGLLFSGGVSEFIYSREAAGFGDMGPLLAEEVRNRLPVLEMELLPPAAGIRATVVGASQHTVQVSGNTIFISTPGALPIRNVPVARPALPLDQAELNLELLTSSLRAAIDRVDLSPQSRSVALAIQWRGSATFARLATICQAIAAAQADQVAAGEPIVLVCDSDVGGLIGLHLIEELRLANPIISIDGVELQEFDYIDIGALLPATGAVPVVIKSLVFPARTPAG